MEDEDCFPAILIGMFMLFGTALAAFIAHDAHLRSKCIETAATVEKAIVCEVRR